MNRSPTKPKSSHPWRDDSKIRFAKIACSKDRERAKWRKRNGVPDAERPEPPYCEICGRAPHEGKSLCIDHCHKTGKFRGWLCHACNLALGNLGDSVENLQSAIKYLILSGQ
jgi:hypothetical protein